jgi:hypothetical protein
MDIQALRQFVRDQSGGVIIRMVDGTEYRLPHPDFAWFTPAAGKQGTRYATAFWLHDPERDETRLVNSMLVKEVVRLPGDDNGTERKP